MTLYPFSTSILPSSPNVLYNTLAILSLFDMDSPSSVYHLVVFLHLLNAISPLPLYILFHPCDSKYHIHVDMFSTCSTHFSPKFLIHTYNCFLNNSSLSFCRNHKQHVQIGIYHLLNPSPVLFLHGYHHNPLRHSN